MKSPLVRHAATYGLYIGLALILLSLLNYLFGLYGQNKIFNILTTWLIPIAGIVWATIQYRDREKGGFISYGDSVGYGVLLSLFYGIITTTFSVLLIYVISPDYADKIMEAAAETLYESGIYTESQIEAVTVMMERFNTPTFMLIGGVVGTAIIGLIISLITSIFTKRTKPMFVND